MSDKAGHLKLLKFLNNQWIAVVEDGREGHITAQAVVTSSGVGDGFPNDRVTRLIQTGKRIVQVSFGQGVWVVLMQEDVTTEGSVEQQVIFTKEFPNDEVSAAWKEKRRVVLVDYLDKQWILVTEKAKSATTVGQVVFFTHDELPVNRVKEELWDKDKKLTYMTYEPTVGWVLVGEVLTGAGQGCSASSDWPEDKIADRISKGQTFADLAWNTNVEAWALVFNNASKTEKISTKVHIQSNFDEDLLRTLSLSRYGHRF